MKRVVALLVAIGLVAGAWFLRSEVIDGDDDGGGAVAADAPRLICATEVRAACERLDDVVVTFEAPGATYARLVGGEPLRADGWLVSQPWPAMAAALDHPLADTSAPLAGSPLTLVASSDPPAGLDCTPLTWTCVATFAGRDPQFAHDGVDSTAGLLTVGGLAGGYLERTDFATNDLELDDGFRTWFTTTERSVRAVRVGGDLVTRLQTARGTYSAVTSLAAGTSVNDRFEATTPAPRITAEVVLAGDPDAFDLDGIRDELDATGWLRFDDKPSAGSTGLPKPGVMVALRDLSR